jgi:hypothetical protein
MLKKLSAVSLALAAGLAFGTAQADLFTFDPTGTAGAGGDINNVALIDQAPGNVLSLGGGAGLVVGSTVTNLYQANLSVLQDADGANLFSNGGGGNFFTFAAGFDEVVTSCNPGVIGGCSVATFALAPGATTNFAFMYASDALGNNLAGTGFTTGDEILSATILELSGVTSVTALGGGNLDQFGANNHPGITTVRSDGSANLTLRVDSVDANYFPDLLSGSIITFSFINSSLITPFAQTNPSRLFSSDGVTNGDVVPAIGPVNGLSGPDFQFQADANQSFVFVRVPEPGTLALLGIALAAVGGFARRRSA